MKSKNSTTLDSFTDYCRQNPDQRFWQALRNWIEADFVLLVRDTTHEELNKKLGADINWSDTWYKD